VEASSGGMGDGLVDCWMTGLVGASEALTLDPSPIGWKRVGGGGEDENEGATSP